MGAVFWYVAVLRVLVTAFDSQHSFPSVVLLFIVTAPQCLCVTACAALILYSTFSTIKSVACRGPARRRLFCCRGSAEPDQPDDVSDTRSSLGAFWLRFWRYNFQPILFVILYCALTIVHMAFYLQTDLDRDTIEQHEVEYHVCILLAAYRTTDMNEGIKECGEHPKGGVPLYNFGA
jgi:hypothetical protein